MSCPIESALAELPEGPLWVAFSGGPDSSVLLHALARRRPPALAAVHVDHGLHGQSAAFAARCQQLAAAWGVRCEVLRIEVAGSGGLEAAAREARYRALAGFLPAGAVLALAHHRDDQAETVLLRLLRGSGGRGLAAMRTWAVSTSGLALWRPLLALPRAAVLDYARRHGLGTLDDPMNLDLRFDRVFLRQHVLPQLERRRPGAAAAIARSARLLAAEDRLRENLIGDALAQCRALAPSSLLAPTLGAIDPALRRPVLERWLAQIGAPRLPGRLLDRLAEGLPALPGHDPPCVCWGGWRFERYREEIHAEPEPEPAGPPGDWDGAQPLAWCGGVLELVGAGRLPFAVRVTPRRGGERLRLPGRSHHHALKDCLQALGIPPWERRRLPLLWAPDGRLVAAGDLLYAADLDAWLRQQRARLRWLPDRTPSGSPQPAC